jgi:alkanesulfonate monooxygenase SsuD/methylene tetrahydromethanopterin reductase-like flavin-dependent oxidoreductase (luciferase family)
MTIHETASSTALAERKTPIRDGNKFKIGLFGMNCSGSVATRAPERWKAEWPETLKAARLADEAGIEFLLPIARWLGYGGETDRHGTTFETLSWASALLSATSNIVVFATVHAPLVHPVFAAKACVTADHVGGGRFALNVVSGWNVGEFSMFGATLREHDERYAFTQEWLQIVNRVWSEPQPFDHQGTYFRLERVEGKPKPWGMTRPVLMSAGSSSAGRAFAMKHADCLFMVISSVDGLAGEIGAMRKGNPTLGIFSSGHLICRPTPQETRDYYHYLIEEMGDWEAAETAIRKRLQGESRSMPEGELHEIKARFISGGGTFPLIGSFDEVVATMQRLSDAGLDGMALATVNYAQDLPMMRDEILPRLERLGLRASRRGSK